MNDLLDRLRRGQVVVGDGAWGTMLMARGLEPGEPPEAVNLRRPELLEEIAREYLEAGAEIITTNTFGGSPARLRQYGLEEQTAAINRAAVAAATRAVAGRTACVSGSIGPSGCILKPYGDADPAEIALGFERQARALAEAGVDLLCVETMTDLAEATLAVRAARAAGPSLPVIAMLTFETTRRGFRTIMGASIADAAAALAEARADIVGSNCGNGIDAMIEIAAEFHAQTRLPIAIRPNAGLPEQRDGRLVHPETPLYFAARTRALVAAGASLVGGCCGTTPAHIRAMRDSLPS